MGSRKKQKRDGREREHRKKRRKRRRSRSRSRGGSSGSDGAAATPPSPRHLLLAAAVGDRSRCRQLVQQGADVAYADAEGTTALHEACRHGHLPAARLLLRRGADAGLGDVRGDTPAHLAARHGHLDLLAELLQADNPPEIEGVNARGESVAALAARAMDKQDVQSFQREAHEAAAAEEERQQRQQQQQLPRGYDQSASLGTDSYDWERRLRDEFSGGEEEGDPWGAYGGGDWHADEYETPEEYARRIWEEMQAHRRAREYAQRAAFTKRRREEEAQRAAFREHAEAASRRILEEQRQQDAEWRAAVAEGQAGAKRASYEARWQFFATKHPEAEIAYADVPWILPAEEPPLPELQRVVLYGTAGPEEQRKRLRTELVRWHPDKFQARFGRRLAPADRDRVLARVNALSQSLNAIAAELPQR